MAAKAKDSDIKIAETASVTPEVVSVEAPVKVVSSRAKKATIKKVEKVDGDGVISIDSGSKLGMTEVETNLQSFVNSPVEKKEIKDQTENNKVADLVGKPEVNKNEIAAVRNTETRNDVGDNKVEASVAPKPYVIPPSPSAANGPIIMTRPYNNMMRPNFPPRFVPRQNTYQSRPVAPVEPIVTEEVSGIYDMVGTDGRGILRQGFRAGENDVLISAMMARQIKLRPGDMVTGMARKPKENEPYWTMMQITKVFGEDPAKIADRPKFEKGTPIYPFEKLKLETGKEILSTRMIDLVAPIGRGQRGLIVSPPKAGKTTVIKEIAQGIASNYPDVHIMAVLVGERPEEVTDISRHILAITKGSAMPGETAASNFDEKAEDQTKVSELALERAKRLVEMGKDVVILLDSITRLARAYNLAIPTSGRTLSGGFDPAALYPPKKFFGAARKIEGGGSLTIIGTALTDTGSRMDDLVYEEFKGTGNMELHLDRRLAERRIYPAIDVMRSSTRRDDLLFDSMEYQSVILMRRMLDMLGDNERTEVIVGRIARTKTNKEFLASLKDGG